MYYVMTNDIGLERTFRLKESFEFRVVLKVEIRILELKKALCIDDVRNDARFEDKVLFVCNLKGSHAFRSTGDTVTVSLSASSEYFCL